MMCLLNPAKNYVEYLLSGSGSGDINDSFAITKLPGWEYVVGIVALNGDSATYSDAETIGESTPDWVLAQQHGTDGSDIAASWIGATLNDKIATWNLNNAGSNFGVKFGYTMALHNTRLNPNAGGVSGDAGTTPIDLTAGGILVGTIAGNDSSATPTWLNGVPDTTITASGTTNSRNIAYQVVANNSPAASVGHSGNGTHLRMATVAAMFEPKWAP